MLYSWVWFVHHFLEQLGYEMTIPQSEVEKYWDLLFDGKKVEAIKLMRTWTGPLTVKTVCFTEYSTVTSAVPNVIRKMTKDFVAPTNQRTDVIPLLDAKLFADFVHDNPRIFE